MHYGTWKHWEPLLLPYIWHSRYDENPQGDWKRKWSRVQQKIEILTWPEQCWYGSKIWYTPWKGVVSRKWQLIPTSEDRPTLGHFFAHKAGECQSNNAVLTFGSPKWVYQLYFNAIRAYQLQTEEPSSGFFEPPYTYEYCTWHNIGSFWPPSRELTYDTFL